MGARGSASSFDADLAIVGGGPAGVATALFLAAVAPRYRERVVVLEKERYPREKICAGAIGARADRALEAIGVRVEVPSVPIRGMSVASSLGGSAARVGHAPRGAAGPLAKDRVIGRVVRRSEFDAALAGEARHRGLRLVEGARVTHLAIDADAVRLTTTQGELRARAVVGADGVGSFVRRALGLPHGELVAQVVEVDTPAASGDPERDVLHFDLTDRALAGYAWDFGTLVDGRPLVCRGVYALHAHRRDAAGEPAAPAVPDVSAVLRARLARQGIATEGLRFKRFAERGLAAHEPFARPRALLVGEAAGIDPLLGEGIAQAILYGAVAGPYLARCLDRDDLSFSSFRRVVLRSGVGFDLRARRRLLPWVFGATRPTAERLTCADAFAELGLRHFAGDPLDAALFARGAVATGRALATSWARRGPWS